MKENETNVAPEGTSPEPAKTAENETIVSSPGVPAGGAGELPQETNVSIIAVVRGYLAEHPIEEWLEPKLQQLKAEILAKVSELVTPIVAKSTEEQAAGPAATAQAPTVEPVAAPASEEHELAVGDPVKVWADRKHRTFQLGTVASVHGEGDAFDVELEGGAMSKVPADGLEFDDRR